MMKIAKMQNCLSSFQMLKEIVLMDCLTLIQLLVQLMTWTKVVKQMGMTLVKVELEVTIGMG